MNVLAFDQPLVFFPLCCANSYKFSSGRFGPISSAEDTPVKFVQTFKMNSTTASIPTPSGGKLEDHGLASDEKGAAIGGVIGIFNLVVEF